MAGMEPINFHVWIS